MELSLEIEEATMKHESIFHAIERGWFEELV